MKKYAALALGLGLALGAAAAEPVVGTLHDVHGAVTLTSAQAVKVAADGMAVPEGASILVARDGAATLVLNNGCVIGLAGSQHLTVRGQLKCSELQASVRQLMPTYQLAQAPLGGGITPPATEVQKAGAASSGVLGGGIATDALAAIVFDTGIVIAAIVDNNHGPASGQ